MASFRVGVPVNIKYRDTYEWVGAANTTFYVDSGLVSSITNDPIGKLPGFTWITTSDSLGTAISVQDPAYGAVGNGTTDDTAAIQNALNAAGATHAEVYLPPTATGYLCSGRLTVPPGVTLRGGNIAIPDEPGYRDNYSAAQAYRGSELRTTANAGSISPTLGFITLSRGASLIGISVFYPNQTATNPPVMYPPCVVFAPEGSPLDGNGWGAGMQNCTLVNPYIGVRIVDHHRPHIRGLNMHALNTGIYVDGSNDVGEINNVHIWPFWVGLGLSALNTYQMTNATAFYFGRTDGLQCQGLFAYGYSIGVNFAKTAKGEPWMSISNLDIDKAGVAILYEGAQSFGVKVMGGTLLSYGGSAVVGSVPTDFAVVRHQGTPAGPLTLVGMTISGTSDAAQAVHVVAGATATLRMNSCHFRDWLFSDANNAGVRLSSTLAEFELSGSRMPSGGYHIDVRDIPTGSNIVRLTDNTYFVTRNVRGTSTAIKGITNVTARVNGTANVAITNGTENTLLFGAEAFDSDNMHDLVTNTDRITFPFSGKYLFGANVRFAASVAGTYRILVIRNQANTALARLMMPPIASASIQTELSVSGVHTFAAGDWINVGVQQDSGGALNVERAVATSPEFWATRISD